MMGSTGYVQLPVTPYRPQDPLENYSRILELQSIRQQQQLQQGEMQLQQGRIQQQRQALQDQQAMTAAMHEWDGKDYNTLPGLMMKHGASAQAVMSTRGGILKQQQEFATLTKDQQANFAKSVELGEESAQRVLAAKPEDRPAVYAQERTQLLQSGLVKPQQVPEQYPGDDFVKLHAKAADASRKFIADTQKAESEAAKSQAESGIAQNKLKMIQNANPADYANLVDQIVPATGANSALNHRTKTLVNFAISRGDLEGAQKALAEATNQVSAIEKETNPAVISARVGQAVATEVAKAKALAPSLQTIMRTTISGGKYISAEDAAGESGNYIRQQAAAAGIPVVSKDTAETLSDIDTARANQNYMLAVIGKKLASDPTGRLYTAPKNTLEKLAQSDPDMAAVGTFRNAAIQSMRAVAGAKGLRINQYEVQLAIDNDIPKLTDTLPVAQSKLKNLQNFLLNAEQSHLLHNRTQMQNAPGQQVGQPPAKHPFFSQFGGAAIGETNPR